MGDRELLWSFVRLRWKSFAVGSVFVLATTLFTVFIPSYVGRAVDLLKSGFEFTILLRICGLILIIEIFKGVARFWMRYIIIGASWRCESDIRKMLLDHLLRLPITYYNTARTGDIIARFTNDLTAVRLMIGPAVMYAMNAVIVLPLALSFMVAKDAELTLYAVLTFPAIAVMINRVGKRIHSRFINVQESYSDISSHVQENLNGIRVVKSYVRENHELGTLRGLSRIYLENNREVIRLQSFMSPLLDILASTGVILVLWVGGRKIMAGETTLGVLVSFIMYINILIWPAISLGWIVAIIQRGMASARRIGAILGEESEKQDDGVDLSPLGGAITVRNLSFAYTPGSPVLDGISFSLGTGQTLAVVGRTGSGKSTLMNILTGAYPVPDGTVFYDDMDINGLPLSRLRSSIAYVPQETFLFSESVSENIAFGKEDARMDDIIRAAGLAAVDEDIAQFPDAYDTVLGERGITISGGQRQRLAIARALISDAPILFFDDCLSSVDTETEMKILSNINRVIENRTAVIVTQRLGAIRNADEILYMKDGVIAERGTHESLMERDGEYAALYNEQETIEALEDSD